MFDVFAEMLLGLLIAGAEIIGEFILEGVVELVAKLPVWLWNAVMEFWKEI